MIYIYTILMRNGDTFRKVWSKGSLREINQQIEMGLEFIRFENCIVRRDEISTLSLDSIAYEEQEDEQLRFSEISPAKLEKPQGFEDCTFKSDNKYNETVLVRCPNSDTSTAVTTQAGKSRVTKHTAVIEDAKEQAVVINDKARKAIDDIDEEQIKADIREAKKGLDEANARFDKIMGILDEVSK